MKPTIESVRPIFKDAFDSVDGIQLDQIYISDSGWMESIQCDFTGDIGKYYKVHNKLEGNPKFDLVNKLTVNVNEECIRLIDYKGNHTLSDTLSYENILYEKVIEDIEYVYELDLSYNIDNSIYITCKTEE